MSNLNYKSNRYNRAYSALVTVRHCAGRQSGVHHCYNDSILAILSICAITPLYLTSTVVFNAHPALCDIYNTNYSYQLFYFDMYESNQLYHADLNSPSHSSNNNRKLNSQRQSNNNNNNNNLSDPTQTKNSIPGNS